MKPGGQGPAAARGARGAGAIALKSVSVVAANRLQGEFDQVRKELRRNIVSLHLRATRVKLRRHRVILGRVLKYKVPLGKVDVSRASLKRFGYSIVKERGVEKIVVYGRSTVSPNMWYTLGSADIVAAAQGRQSKNITSMARSEMFREVRKRFQNDTNLVRTWLSKGNRKIGRRSWFTMSALKSLYARLRASGKTKKTFAQLVAELRVKKFKLKKVRFTSGSPPLDVWALSSDY